MKYEDIVIGQTAELTHTITAKDVRTFINLTGDNNKVHTGAGGIVHGMLAALFISTIIGTRLPGDGAIWFKQNLIFLEPVRIGDRLIVTAEVINKTVKFQHVELCVNIHNQHHKLVTTGVAWVKVLQ